MLAATRGPASQIQPRLGRSSRLCHRMFDLKTAWESFSHEGLSLHPVLHECEFFSCPLCWRKRQNKSRKPRVSPLVLLQSATCRVPSRACYSLGADRARVDQRVSLRGQPLGCVFAPQGEVAWTLSWSEIS